MIIVLKQNAPDAQVHEFCRELEGMGLQINDSKGSDTHILGLIGDTKAIAESWVLANPVVETCRRVSEPYKKANRKFHPDDSIIDVNGVKIGGGNFAVIAGPCSIESEEQITYCAQRVKDAGASSSFSFNFFEGSCAINTTFSNVFLIRADHGMGIIINLIIEKCKILFLQKPFYA